MHPRHLTFWENRKNHSLSSTTRTVIDLRYFFHCSEVAVASAVKSAVGDRSDEGADLDNPADEIDPNVLKQVVRPPFAAFDRAQLNFGRGVVISADAAFNFGRCAAACSSAAAAGMGMKP